VTHDCALLYLGTFNFHGNVTISSDVALNAVHVMPCLVRDDWKLLKFMLFHNLIVLSQVPHLNDWSYHHPSLHVDYVKFWPNCRVGSIDYGPIL